MSIRLFVAVAFPSDIKDRLAALCSGLNEAKWVSPANFHLTLRFIGPVNEAQVDDIMAALGSVRAPAFSVDLDGIGHFGSGHKLRMVWARVVPNPALELLGGRVEAALVRCGLVLDPRKFTPHVTLARFKRAPSPERLGQWIATHSLFRAGPIGVDHFTLFSSITAEGGAQYQAEAEFPLEGGWHLDEPED